MLNSSNNTFSNENITLIAQFKLKPDSKTKNLWQIFIIIIHKNMGTNWPWSVERPPLFPVFPWWRVCLQQECVSVRLVSQFQAASCKIDARCTKVDSHSHFLSAASPSPWCLWPLRADLKHTEFSQIYYGQARWVLDGSSCWPGAEVAAASVAWMRTRHCRTFALASSVRGGGVRHYMYIPDARWPRPRGWLCKWAAPVAHSARRQFP